MTPLFIQCYPLGFHDIRVDGLQEGGPEKDWAASRLHSLTEEMCPLAFHLASCSLCPFPSLPLVSDDGWSCPHLSSPTWALCLSWAVVLPSRTLPNLSHTRSQIERWYVSFPEEALWGTLPSFFVDPTLILFAKCWVKRVLPLPVEEQTREMGASFLQCSPLPHTARPVSLQLPRTAWSLCTCQTRGCVCGPFSLNISSSFYSNQMPYFILRLNYVQGGSENKSRNTILTDQILINVIIFLFCEDKNSVMKYYHFLYVIFYNCFSVFYLLLSICVWLLWPHGLQHARLSCPSLSPGACSNSCPLSQWCHPTISSSVVPFSSCFLSFPASGFSPNESALCIRWPKCWSFRFSTHQYSGFIFFRIDWFNLLEVQGTLKSLLQHHSSKASILQCSAFFMVQFSHPYMTTGKTTALTR